MRIESSAVAPISPNSAAFPAWRAGEGSFLAALTKATGNGPTGTAPASPAVDFNNATRQELFDWMNSQIRSGQMSVEESAPFLAMTFKFDPVTHQHVDMATDTSRIDFMQRARDGIEGALWRFDDEGAERLRVALATMEEFDV